MRTYYGNYRNIKFCDVWDNAEDFVNDYKDSGLYADNNKITDDSATTLFYLLYSKYGNSTIASSDVNQFKYKVFGIIYAFGPTWEKEIELQNTIRNLTPEQLELGSVEILNHAFNPSSAPTTQTTNELEYINEQNVSKSKRGKIDAYNGLILLLRTDVTSRFLSKFKKLFLQILAVERPLYYVEEVEDDE